CDRSSHNRLDAEIRSAAQRFSERRVRNPAAISCQYSTRVRRSARMASTVLDRPARFVPGAKAAIHGCDVLIAHLLQAVGSEGRTIPASAIEHDLAPRVRDHLLDVSFQDPLAEMNCPRQ